MPAIFFVYGLAFFVLGVVLLVYPMRQSRCRLVSNLKLIAAFGILHGLNEWVDLLILVRQGEEAAVLHWIRFGLLPLSFVSLLWFATKAIAQRRGKEPPLRYLPILLFALWILFTVSSGDFFLMGDIWARYLLALPGTFLTAYALLLEEEALRDTVSSELTGYIGLSAGAFIFYGMFAGLVVPEADFFPASLINTSLFSQSGGMPVQIFRTLCAVTIAYSLTRVLAIVSLEPDGNGTGDGSTIPKNQDRNHIEAQDANGPRQNPLPSPKEEPVKEDPSNPEKEFGRDPTLFEAMGAALDDGICIQDREYRILYQNTAHKTLLGDHMGERCYEAFKRRHAPCAECPVTRSLEDGQTHRSDKVTTTSKGIRYLKFTAAPLKEPAEDGAAVVQAVRDITDRAKMEERLLKLEKIESLELMAAGIAHDLNNLLTTVLGNIDLVKYRTDPQTQNYDSLDSAVKSCRLARELGLQLMTFSKGGSPMRTPVCVEELLRDVANLSFSGSRTKCRLSLPQNLWTMNVDEGQIAQVIHNLLINAAQATEQTGTVELAAENISVTAGQEFPLKDGPYVRIGVTDHGTGIAVENMKRIFHPYFTTKATGKGLGLTIAHTIIEKHGGHMAVASAKGTTTFWVYLPASSHIPGGHRNAKEVPGQTTGKVLVMDDQKSIREVAREILTCLGHRVEVAANGTEATQLYRQAKESGDPFDLVILDLTVTDGPGGEETMKKLQAMDPPVRAIVSSGYSEDPVMSEFQAFGFTGRLRKPYNMGELSRAVRSALLRAS